MKTSRHGAIRWVVVPDAAEAQGAGVAIEIEREKLKHLRKVLRTEWNEELRVIDGVGRVFRAVLEKRGDSGAARLEELLFTQPKLPETELVVCMPKNSTMDWIIEKAVECQATQVTPVVSSRSVVKPDRGDLAKYLHRWRMIADQALEQSEQAWHLRIAEPIEWKSWIKPVSKPSLVFSSELRGQVEEKGAVQSLWGDLANSKTQAVSLLIGPEGGFAPYEREELLASGWREHSLGKMVLRVETAIVSALTLMRVSRLVSRS
ncbi:MAG: RsmE family RNA methyltransferase [Bdellovibrionota bacterium]